jgi:ADP-glucose pyrophosphorylase
MTSQTELRGIVLAGGTGSRLFPLTKVTNKHLLPVGHEPMIFHPVRKLVEAGIREILIVTGTEHMGDVVGLLGSGTDFGCEFTYRVQDQAGGIAQAWASRSASGAADGWRSSWATTSSAGRSPGSPIRFAGRRAAPRSWSRRCTTPAATASP